MGERAKAWATVVAAFAVLTAGLLYGRSGSERPPRPAPAALASPAATPGAVGGLLPDVSLRGRYGVTPARQLRPAVVMLARPGCDCVEIVRQVVEDATPAGVVTYVVVAGPATGDAERIAAQAGGDAGAFTDPDGALAAVYRLRTDAALVLVRRDGVVTQVVAGVAPSLQLGSALRALVA